jgi:cell division protein ZipA
MSVNYLIISVLVATCFGLAGLGLLLIPNKQFLSKIIRWHNKKTRVASRHQMPSPRSEPRLHKTDIGHLQLMSDTHPLLFEDNAFSSRKFSILYLMAPPNQDYTGYILWQALMSQKLRYGSMKIFHAYDTDDTSGNILFSVANALEPGYFDENHIDKIKITGLCLFMRHHSLSQSLKVFQSMLKAAKRLEHLLGGTLCDNQRRPLSESTIQNYYNKFSLLASDTENPSE